MALVGTSVSNGSGITLLVAMPAMESQRRVVSGLFPSSSSSPIDARTGLAQRPGENGAERYEDAVLGAAVR